MTRSARVEEIATASLADLLFEHTNDLVIELDPTANAIVDANPIACGRLGYTRDELLALEPAVIHDDGAAFERFIAGVLREGRGFSDALGYVTRNGSRLPAHVVGVISPNASRPRLLLLARAGAGRTWAEDVLRTVAEGVATTTGEPFFRSLVRNVASVLGVRFVFVTELAGSLRRVRSLAAWDRDHFADPFEYDLEGTPCEAVLAGEIRFYPRNVQQLFPRDTALRSIDAESFLAIPLIDDADRVLGHLAIFHDQPLAGDTMDHSIFRIFAARATSELKHEHAEAALRESEQRLAGILGSAMDAIITIDSDHRITLFNAAAERMFRCGAAWAIGQPLERLLPKPFRNLLASQMEAINASPARERQLWAPEGFTARRANGEEFPIDATISRLDVEDQQQLYTVILRDVSERQRAQEEARTLLQERRYLQEQVTPTHEVEGLIASSPAMQQILDRLRKVAVTDSTVLLLGETGTGKELLARAIHHQSRRKDRLLVALNCAALPGELIESELFGHEKGAFTGATQQRKGRFELADGGTLFLDEVAELSPAAQAKLLRVLQTQTFERVGGTRAVVCDARVVAATNRDLAARVQEGSFRPDLYYRLNVFPIELPPLRDRREDILLLARHFLGEIGSSMGKKLVDFTPASARWLEGYAWPGNVRELRNLIERGAILASDPIVDLRDALPGGETTPASGPSIEPGNGTLEAVERAHVLSVLTQTSWVLEGRRGAAAILGLHPNTLRYRLKKLGLKRPRAPSAS